MPIIGFKPSARPALIGEIHKGTLKKKNAKGVDIQGDDLVNRFRFTSKNTDVVKAFQAAYGTLEPTVVTAIMPFTDPGDVFTLWSEIWDASGLVHRCDGEHMHLKREGSKIVNYEQLDATFLPPCPGGHKDNDPRNDAIGRLYFFVPGLLEAGLPGVIMLSTKSKNDIAHIQNELAWAFDVRSKSTDPHERSLGVLGLVYELYRQEESISAPGFGNRAGSRSRVNKSLVKLRNLDTSRLMVGVKGHAIAYGNGTEEIVTPEPDDDDDSSPEETKPAVRQPAETKEPEVQPPTMATPEQSNGNESKQQSQDDLYRELLDTSWSPYTWGEIAERLTKLGRNVDGALVFVKNDKSNLDEDGNIDLTILPAIWAKLCNAMRASQFAYLYNN